MTIHEFAIKHRLKVRQDKDDGTDIIPGKPGFSHIYEYCEDELGVMYVSYATCMSHLDHACGMPTPGRRWRLA
jgi:hypothetical protein